MITRRVHLYCDKTNISYAFDAWGLKAYLGIHDLYIFIEGVGDYDLM